MPMFISHDILTQKANVCPSPLQEMLEGGRVTILSGEKANLWKGTVIQKGQSRLAFPSRQLCTMKLHCLDWRETAMHHHTASTAHTRVKSSYL